MDEEGARLVSSRIESSCPSDSASDTDGQGVGEGGGRRSVRAGSLAAEADGELPRRGRGLSSAMIRLMEANMSSIEGSGRMSAMDRYVPYFVGGVTGASGTTAETLG